MNSRETRFHAAQLFHTYFLLPEKVQYWREEYKFACFERECCESHDSSNYERSIWNLAVACMALSAKVYISGFPLEKKLTGRQLHRDVLTPLGSVYAVDFLALAPYPMTHETFEVSLFDDPS